VIPKGATTTWPRYLEQRYCNKRCKGLAERPRLPNAQYKQKYRWINTPDGRRMTEHRWVVEQHIGRPLRAEEHIHHINHDSLDNRIENLEIVSTAEHGLRHTWHPITKVCEICGVEFTPLATQRARVRTCGKQCGYQLRMRTLRGVSA
jgi:hypothetical protein